MFDQDTADPMRINCIIDVGVVSAPAFPGNFDNRAYEIELNPNGRVSKRWMQVTRKCEYQGEEMP